MADPAAKEDPKQETEQLTEQETEEKVSPGLDPNPDPQVVVNAVNPPITPDQVVSMAESPSAAVLPDVKLQNIKISPVKNKTIQGHLAAIEAKMIATEKLMKDVVKLQKRQISTEKELHQRRRELYQNTFEEYLLDKTIDFENSEGSNLPKLVKQKSDKNGGGGMPLVNPLRRNPTKPGATKPGANKPGANKPGATRPGVKPKVSPLTQTTPSQPGKIINPATGKTFTQPGASAQQPFSATQASAPGLPKTPPVTAKTSPLSGLKNLKIPKITPGSIAAGAKGLATGATGLGIGVSLEMGGNYLIEQGFNAALGTPEERLQKFKEGYDNASPEVRKKVVEKLQNELQKELAFQKSPLHIADKVLRVGGQTISEGKSNNLMQTLEVIGAKPQVEVIDDKPQSEVIDAKPQSEVIDAKPQASGGINDVNLYHSSSQQYFRDVSSKLEIPKFGGGGLSTAGVRPGFTGMNAQGFNAITGGDKFRPGGFKPQILGRGAYSAPTNQGAMRYAGGQSSLGMPQQPGGVVKTIVPGSAPRFPFLEQQMRVKPATFDKGRVLANKVQSGAYPRSNLAGRMRTGMRGGGAPMRMSVPKVPKLSHPFVMLAEMIINELVSPQSTAVYDQVTGPNAYYNAPGYKGPMPSQNLENAQSTMMDGTSNQQPQIVPLPPDYIKLPGKPKEKTYNTFEVPGIDLEPSMFTRPSRYID